MTFIQWQEVVSDRAAQLENAALKNGESFSEGLCNWAIARAMEEIPKPLQTI